MQKNGFSLRCNVIPGSTSHPKKAETERESFTFFVAFLFCFVLFFYFFIFCRMPDSCIVFGSNNKTDSW